MTAKQAGMLVTLVSASSGLAAATASAHFERPVRFPNPAPDRSVSPPAGGDVPVHRRSGRALIVCRRGSLLRARKRGATRRQLARNRRLRKRCRFSSIQTAVNRARNGNRILILPGVYRERRSRRKPTFDDSCARFRVRSREQGRGEEPQGPSYRYQANCPNDQNLIAVIGRRPGSGRCVRCNLQIEGTGRHPGDVVIDAAPRRGIQGKDVGLRGDRADGLYVRNLTVQGAAENGFYVIETDGYAIRRAIARRNSLYGFLTFVSDHGVHHRCEAYLNDDAGIYPGASPDSAPRLNQRISKCNSHHNTLGVSGTMGNSVLFEDNRFHHNAVGFNLDSFLAANHPGYPQDSTVLRANRIYSNNFNVYAPGSPLEPAFSFPVGTGIYLAGGNRNVIEGNRIYDNWRRGSMLISVPGPAGRPPPTSHRNVHRGNRMGVAPGGRSRPNGVDFWWDEQGRGNCWERNGRATSDPPALDACPGGVGDGDGEKNAELAACGSFPEAKRSGDCDWFQRPPRPGGGGARSAATPLVALCPPLGPLRCLDQGAAAASSAPVSPRGTCREWNGSAPAARAGVVRVLRASLAADPQFHGAPIVPERTAGRRIALACRQPVAAGFSLFSLFTRAATDHAASRS